jgi:hypothetical protein
MPDTTLTALREASRGLFYPSESDAPLRVFRWKDCGKELSAQVVSALARQRRDAPVEEVSMEDFFGELEEGEEAERFRKLRRVLEEHLSGVRVFRIGAVKVKVYVVGKTQAGDWAGLQTTSVET